MNYDINLFGYNTECLLTVENDKLVIRLSDDNQKSLESYLSRVLLRYAEITSGETRSLNLLIEKAIEIEKNIGGNMSEPKIKLPYEFAPEIKEKLIEAAAIQGISATQLLIKLVEAKHQKIMNNV